MDESFEQIKREIIGECERRNSKLSDCLRTMESIYDKQKTEYQRKQSMLESEIKELRKKLEFALNIGTKPKNADDPRRVKFTNTNNVMVEELEAKVKDLTAELAKKEELVGYRRKRDDWGRMKLEAEVKALRKKATVGWMLGSLWEASLQGDELGDTGETSSIVKMLRKLQKDLERENLNASGGSNDLLDKDVQTLLEHVETTIQKSGKMPSRLEASRKDERKDEPTNRPSSPRLIPRGMLTSPRSPRSPASPRSPKMTTHFKLGGMNRDREPSPVKTPQLLTHEETSPNVGGGTIGIRQMLSSIDANIKMLLENERRRSASTPSGDKPGSPPLLANKLWKR